MRNPSQILAKEAKIANYSCPVEAARMVDLIEDMPRHKVPEVVQDLIKTSYYKGCHDCPKADTCTVANMSYAEFTGTKKNIESPVERALRPEPITRHILRYYIQGVDREFKTRDEARAYYAQHPLDKEGLITSTYTIGNTRYYEVNGYFPKTSKEATETKPLYIPMDITEYKMQVNQIYYREYKGTLYFQANEIDLEYLRDIMKNSMVPVPEEIYITAVWDYKLNGDTTNLLNFFYNAGTRIVYDPIGDIDAVEFENPEPTRLKYYVYETVYQLPENVSRYLYKINPYRKTFTYDDLYKFNKKVGRLVKHHNKMCWQDKGFYDSLIARNVFCTLPKQNIYRQHIADLEFKMEYNHGVTVTDDELKDLDNYGKLFGVEAPVVTIKETVRLLTDKSVLRYREIVDYYEEPNYGFGNGLEYAGNDIIDEDSEHTLYTEIHHSISAKKAKENIELMNWYQFMNVLDDRYVMCECGLATRADRVVCQHCGRKHIQARKDIAEAINICRQYPVEKRFSIEHLPTDKYMDLEFTGKQFRVIRVKEMQIREDLIKGYKSAEDVVMARLDK